MTAEGRDWVEMAQLRQALYRFFGGGLLPPDRGRVEGILEAADVLDGAGIDDFAFAVPWHSFTSVLDELPSLEDMSASYGRLFTNGARRASCPAVESEYTAPAGAGAALVAVALEREYRELNLELGPTVLHPADHAACELEAMAFLCHREAHAWDDDATSGVVEVRRAEWRFLHRRLGRWFPTFARRLRETVPADRFYVALVDAADAFVQHDQELIVSLVGARAART